eukprot:318281-Pelagomonas_calceolata.AAC.1
MQNEVGNSKYQHLQLYKLAKPPATEQTPTHIKPQHSKEHINAIIVFNDQIPNRYPIQRNVHKALFQAP